MNSPFFNDVILSKIQKISVFAFLKIILSVQNINVSKKYLLTLQKPTRYAKIT